MVYAPSYTRTDTAIYSISAVAAAAILTAAWWLEPAAQGLGTHRQLGLPPCWFLSFTGLPCPGCGLTTSFAHAAKFHFLDAAHVQPFGVLQFVLIIASIPGIALLMARRVPLDAVATWPGLGRVVWIWTTLYLCAWVYKVAQYCRL